MIIEIVDLIQSDFEHYSTISVFENQTQFVLPIANVLSRFSGNNPEEYLLISGASRGTEAAGIIIITDRYETAQLKNQELNVCWIDTLAVDKKYQRQGIGRKLLGHAISALRSKFDCICLTVNLRNKSAKSMYNKCGFIDAGELYFGGPSGPQHILKCDLSGRLQDRE